MDFDLDQIHVQLLSQRQDYLKGISNPSTGKNASAAMCGGRYGRKGRNFRIDTKRLAPAMIGRLTQEPGERLGRKVD